LHVQLDKSFTIDRIIFWVSSLRRKQIYAIVETGGKQHKVSPGQVINVEKMPGDPGDAVQLDRVLLVADGDNCSVGKPILEGAKVKATIVEHGKHKKIIVFKYKNKTRYRRKRGHRQQYTRLSIEDIIAN